MRKIDFYAPPNIADTNISCEAGNPPPGTERIIPRTGGSESRLDRVARRVVERLPSEAGIADHRSATA